MVDLSSGKTRVVGRKGEGPREFGHIGRATRTPQGILVWDVPRRRVVIIAHDGEFLRSEGYAQLPLQDFTNAYPVAVHPDGRIVYRDGIYRSIRDYDGRTWNPATYVAAQDAGELQIVARAKGDEAYYGAKRSGSVVFGHRTFEAATEDRLIIAETDRGAIAVLDWSGREVAEIPMPAGVRLPAAQVVGRQLLVSRWERFEELLKRAAASGRVPYTPGNRVGSSHPDFKDWPINEVPPRSTPSLQTSTPDSGRGTTVYPIRTASPGGCGTLTRHSCSSQREWMERTYCSMRGATWSCCGGWTRSMFPEPWSASSGPGPAIAEDLP